ncbi:MAG: hypothetical protein ACRD1E_08730 [Terriglobales bacterium]
MSYPLRLRLLLITAVLGLALAPAAHATDGVVLINQATSLNGLPGCGSSGFPIVICQPGSYRLAGNLVVAAAAANGIEIEASHVTLDLNGFTLEAAGDAATGTGILDAHGLPVDDLTVENGTVAGFQNGIAFSSPSHSAVLRSLVVEAGEVGAALARGSVLDCHIYGAGVGLLFTSGPGLVLRNFLEAAGNDFALAALGNIAYGDNVIAGGLNGGVSLGTNACNGTRC